MSKQSKGNQDIRSFFQVKSTSKLQLKPTAPSSASKRPAKVIVSSDDDVIPESPLPEPKKQTKVLKKRKINVVSSDSEDETISTVKVVKEDKKKALKPISALEAFGKEPIKQAKVPDQPKIEEPSDDNSKVKQKRDKKSKNKYLKVQPTEPAIHDDPDFEKTLLELDEDLLLQNVDELDKSVEQALRQSKVLNEKQSDKISNGKTESKTKVVSEKHKTKDNCTDKVGKPEPIIKEKVETTIADVKQNNKHDKVAKTEAVVKAKEIETAEVKHVSKKRKIENSEVDSSSKKTHISSSDDDKKQNVKQSHEDYDGDPDQEKYEKKRYSAMLYQKYLNRSGPAHHGSKEIPKGKPDCLRNLCFLRTGVLDSLENDEFEELIKDHGGRVVHGVSKKVNYLVVGEDPGPAKLEKAKSYGIGFLSEDELLDLIRTKSSLETKHSKEKQEEGNLVTKKNQESKSKSVKAKLDGSSQSSSVKAKVDVECKPTSSSKSSSHSGSKSNKDSTSKSSSLSSLKSSSHSSSKLSNDSISKPSGESTSKLSKDSTIKSSPVSTTASGNNLSWTEKYKPTSIKNIIGQQGDKSNMKRLMVWLQNWYKNHSGPNKPKLIRPSPWAKNDDGSYFKAALLSGPPGVGKTTTADLVAKELGFDIVEFNASDTRSKKLLHEEVSQLLANKSLAGFFSGGSEPTSKHVLLMDEVDGMAGNEDRGGMQELILLIKNSKVPIICMCNDRNHQKIRSLANYCLDLRVSRPRLEQIRGAMMSVCFKEGLKISSEALSEVITGAGMDVRQILTHLSMWSADNKVVSNETATKEAKASKKDTPLGPWEVCRKVFSAEEHKSMSIADRSRLFYYDYSLAPLFVQDNYLGVLPHAPKEEHLKRFSLAADAISMGDLIDTKIRKTNNWSLLDVEAMCSSVLPGHYLAGHVKEQIGFPSWLGKNSKKNKFSRILSELQAHMRLSISASKLSVNLDYVTHLRNNIVKPLVNHGTSGVSESLELMHSYSLLREDLDNIIELAQWPHQKNPMNMVDSKVKAAFTRAYNKDSAMLPYAIQTAPTKKRGTAESQVEGLEDEEEDVNSSAEEDDINKDAMVKAKKAPSKKSVKNSETTTSKRSAAGSSKGGAKRSRK